MVRKPFIDQDVCIGCGLCAETVPGVFRMNEENVAQVYNAAGATELKIQEVMDNCPVNCIHWE